MDAKLVKRINETLQDKSTEELQQILNKRDASQWSEEAFEAIEQVLSRRNATKVNVQDLTKHGDME